MVVTEQMQRESCVDEDILVINVVIVMFAVEPFRNVFDLGEHQRRADWIERLRLVERCRRPTAEPNNVGEKFSGSPLS